MRTERKHRHRRRYRVRKRAAYLAAAAVAIGLGLASRTYASSLPPFVAENAGDALWAGMVYGLIRLLLPDHRPAVCALYALLLSFGIEFSQLYKADWIDGLRETTIGALVLGRGFLTVDLVRYIVGIALVWGMDAWGIRRHRRSEAFREKEAIA